MAKTPASTKVAVTSGQGVSRLAYQKAYALSKEAGVTGARQPKMSGGQLTSGRNDYAKSSITKAPKDKADAAPSFDAGKPPKSSVSLKKAAAKKYETPKEDSGFLKGKK